MFWRRQRWLFGFPGRERVPDSTMRMREMRLLVARADVYLQMLVADAAHYIRAEFVPAEFSAGMTIHEADLAAGPGQRRFFNRHRFNRRIIFSILWIDHRARSDLGGFLTRLRADQRRWKITNWRVAHSTERRRTWKTIGQILIHRQIAKQGRGIDTGEKFRTIKPEDGIEISSANRLRGKNCRNS